MAKEALGLYRRLARRAYKGKLGKTVPPWTLPREIWRIFFSPDRFARRGQRSIEHDPMIPLSAPRTRHALLDLLLATCRQQRLPLACRSMRFLSQKPMGNAWCTHCAPRQRFHARTFCAVDPCPL